MSRRRRPRKAELMVPVASLGDLAFLLIIFFMVCSNFAKQKNVELTPPRSIDVDQLGQHKIFVDIDKEGQIYLQGRKVDDAKAVEWGVAALIKDKETDDQKTVVFKCDSETPRSVYEPVVESIAKAGALIAAIGEKRK